MKISIEYCQDWNYKPRAVSLADELHKKYGSDIEDLTFIPSAGGVFEVIVDGNLVFSKKNIGRHANQGEVVKLIEQR